MRCPTALLVVFFLFALIAKASTLPAQAQSAAEEPGEAFELFLPGLSLTKATEYLDARARAHEDNCCACHGSFAYLTARPVISLATPRHRDVRQALEEYSAKLAAAEPRPERASPLHVSESVMTATVLAQHDAATESKLHPLTRKALDRLWDLQREDGGWNWFINGKPPSETDEQFGVTMAAIGVGIAPDKYADTPQARKGLEGIRGYFREHPPTTMHQRALLLLAAGGIQGLLTEQETEQSVADLFALQQPEGGWAMSGLGDWKRADGKPLDPTAADGYGTGFVLYVLRRGGRVPADEPRLQKAVLWLKTHQRSDGSWFTPSPYKSGELSTFVGTAYVILALDACGEPRPTGKMR